MEILRKAIRWKQDGRIPYCSAVIVAAGSATRMNGIDKMMAKLGGRTVLERTLQTFNDCSCIAEIIVVTREDLMMPVSELCRSERLDKVRCVMIGGDERTNSVMAGIDCVSKQAALIAIHDGARPLVTEEIIRRTVLKAAETGAAAPAVPMKDTVKVARHGVIEATPERSTLYAVQTPQIFDADLIRGALYKAEQENITVTDDCSAVERIGMKVHLTEGSDENVKITTPIDLILAQTILDGREKA
jgi:2-C-methyl-D-erythritol 4-phosphate cytidylyltransferase